jgi:hypothetical protein
MTTQDRYLHFDNIDMRRPDIHARCSHCGQEFSATPKASERVDDVVLRIRAEYDAHKC